MRRTVARSSRFTAVAVAAALLAVACGNDDEDPDAGTGTTTASQDTPPGETTVPSFETTPLTFSLSSRSLSNQMAFTADEGGFFECYGIDAELVVSESSAIAMAALLSGDVQFMLGSRSEGVLTRAAGQEVRYLLKHSSGFATGVTVSSNVLEGLDSDVDDMSLEERVQALEGLTIASPSEGSILTLALRKLLDEHGVTVEFVFIDGPTMGAALAQGNIDGYMFPSPFQETTAANGEGGLLIEPTEMPTGGPESVQGPVYVTDSYLEENPEIASRVAAAFIEAAEFMRDDEEAAKDLVHARFQDIPEEVFDLVWETNYDTYVTPLESPLTIEDIEFIIENDAPDDPEVQALDPADLMPPASVIDDARELAERVTCD